jgi:translation initiation factor 6 (eIF-6)
MKTTKLTNQIEFEKVVRETNAINNVCYANENLAYIPIDWRKEYVKIIENNGFTTVERIKYNCFEKLIKRLKL